MTCIIGLKENGKVYLGSDSRGILVNGNIQDGFEKIFKIEKYTFAISGQFGLRILFQHLNFSNISYSAVLDILKNMSFFIKDEYKKNSHLLITNGAELGYIDLSSGDYKYSNEFDMPPIFLGDGQNIAQNHYEKYISLSPIDRIKNSIDKTALDLPSSVGGEPIVIEI